MPLASLSELLHFGVPLWICLVFWLLASILVLFFGFLYRKGEALAEGQAAALEKENAELLQEHEELNEELREINHGYSTMAVLIEEIHQQLADLHKHEDQQDRRIDILGQRQDILSDRQRLIELQHPLPVKSIPETDYTGPDIEESEDEPYAEPSATPDPAWLDEVREELDQL